MEIYTADLDDAHPNTAEITLTSEDGTTVSLRGSSIGGGNIMVTKVNGMDVSLTGQHTTSSYFIKTPRERLRLSQNSWQTAA